ncbi:lipase family protein [Cellulosimicrobium cellulans]|uniref:lipase family protein n=1 Tax=Cellulosimicrobium cellulans TaxID=1710 RepID=UPI000849084B|nr:lipase family protein [Cellulosimicrobium cellulans]
MTKRARRAAAGPRRSARVLLATLALVAVGVVGLEAVRVAGDAEERAGLLAFYDQPPGAADGDPGTVVRSEVLLGTPPGARAWRVMYRSTDLRGAPVVVTGVIVTPLGPAPPGGRTVLAWGHPTTGTAPSCAPSRAFDPFLGIEGLRLMLDRGYTVVATDYAGMGTAGPDSYLVGGTAARSVLDAVRAARHVPDAGAGDRVVLWGHSQGGQAVLFAAQGAASYAPGLDVVAVATAAPAADLTALMGSHRDDVSGVTIGSYAFPAFASVYGATVPGARLGDVLTPAAVRALPAMNRLCLLSHLDELHRLAQPLVGDFFARDPTAVEPWATLLTENSAGGSRVDAPLFVAQGTDDELVLPADTRELVRLARSTGTDVTYRTVPDATHATVAYLALPALDAWLDDHVG